MIVFSMNTFRQNIVCLLLCELRFLLSNDNDNMSYEKRAICLLPELTNTRIYLLIIPANKYIPKYTHFSSIALVQNRLGGLIWDDEYSLEHI